MIEEGYYVYDSIDVDGIDILGSENAQGAIINLNGVTVTTAYAASGSKDHKLVVSDGVSEIDIYVKGVLSDLGESLFAALSVGDVINIQNLAVSCFTNAQLLVIETTAMANDEPLPPENVEALDPFVPEDPKRMNDAMNDYEFVTVGMPSTGDVNVLVIPIAFTDQTIPENYKDILETAFNGTSAETGWESLASYYYKSSYGKLNLHATILDAYQTGERYSASLNDDSGKDGEWFAKAIRYYDDAIDYTNYDANGDGYIDCVYLIYLAPYSTKDGILWWAFTTELFEDEDVVEVDGLGLDFYQFVSYEFFFDPIRYGETEADDVYIAINCETIIHETGHALGLDDYYDYDDTVGAKGGIGGGVMMDANVGDHDPYSKLILGWTDATVVQGKDHTATIAPFAESGDVLLIARNWQDSYYAEYYLIEYYTPDGVNVAQNGYNGLPGVAGVRVYHVIATLAEDDGEKFVFNMTIYNNSDTKYNLISLVEADGKNCILKDEYGLSNDNDLFQVGGTFMPKWYDGTSAGCTVTIGAIDANGATVIIDYV